jgi:hypothetical protein
MEAAPLLEEHAHEGVQAQYMRLVSLVGCPLDSLGSWSDSWLPHPRPLALHTTPFTLVGAPHCVYGWSSVDVCVSSCRPRVRACTHVVSRHLLVLFACQLREANLGLAQGPGSSVDLVTLLASVEGYGMPPMSLHACGGTCMRVATCTRRLKATLSVSQCLGWLLTCEMVNLSLRPCPLSSSSSSSSSPLRFPHVQHL